MVFDSMRWSHFFRVVVFVGGIGLFVVPPAVLAQEEGYEEWLQQQREEYEAYLSEQDKAFLEFLDREWKEAKVGPSATSPLDDKPADIPRVETPSPSDRPEQQRQPSADPPPPQNSDAPDEAASSTDDPSTPEGEEFFEEGGDTFEQNEEAASTRDQESFADEELTGAPSDPSSGDQPSDAPSSETAQLDQEVEVSFYGETTTIPYGEALIATLQGTPDQTSIQSFWKTLAEAHYRPTLEVLQKQKRERALGDWGYYLYLREFGAQLYGEAERAGASSDATLWTWFMLMKSGYDARVGFQGGDVFLMLPVEEQIFDRPQLHFEGQRYYLMGGEIGGESLRTYEGTHPEAKRVLRLQTGMVPSVSEARKTRSVAFSFQGERLEMDVAYNPVLTDYLDAYPNVELDVLFHAGVSSVARESLGETLGPLVEELSPRESVNLLLKFAQFSTQYKRDQDHFGEERFLFPEETLAFEYSDCEDRAVLLGYLIRTLLDRDVVGLEWSRHVALAVRGGEGLDVEESDRVVTVNGTPYVFADPTYIGSTLGMEMPFVEGTEPEIIDL